MQGSHRSLSSDLIATGTWADALNVTAHPGWVKAHLATGPQPIAELCPGALHPRLHTGYGQPEPIRCLGLGQWPKVCQPDRITVRVLQAVNERREASCQLDHRVCRLIALLRLLCQEKIRVLDGRLPPSPAAAIVVCDRVAGDRV